MFNERHRLIYTRDKGKDPIADEVINNPESEKGHLYLKTLSIFKSSLKRRYLESSLMCESDVTKISEMLEIPVNVIEGYKEFFFDINGLDRLGKIEHIESLSKEDRTRDEALLKMWALTHGIDFIAWRLGYKVDISPIEGLQDLFATCVYKAKEATFSSSTSDAGRESIKWIKQSSDLAKLLKIWVMDSSAARQDLEIAMREVMPEFEGMEELLKANGEETDRTFEVIDTTMSLEDLVKQNRKEE